MNVRESRRSNQEWTIPRQWQHCEQKTEDKIKKKNPQHSKLR